MANICPTEESSADEIAKSKPGQHKANTEVQGQNGALTTFQEVTNFVPGYANYNLNTSTAESKIKKSRDFSNLNQICDVIHKFVSLLKKIHKVSCLLISLHKSVFRPVICQDTNVQVICGVK